jgi:hypothetical protein
VPAPLLLRCLGGIDDSLLRGVTLKLPLRSSLTAEKFGGPSAAPAFTRASSGVFLGSNGLLQSALTNIPRFDYGLPANTIPGYLSEAQATNLLLRSEEFDNASWTKANLTVSANAIAAPDGLSTADKLIPSAASTVGRAYQLFTGVIGTTYILSVYGKAGEFNTCRLYVDDNASNVVSVSYNLTTKAVSTALTVTGGNWTAASSTIVDLGNGWVRVSLTFTATAVAPQRAILWCQDTGDGTSGIYLWGAQLEAGSTPTSYIPTTSGPIVRGLDLLTYPSAGNISHLAGSVSVWVRSPWAAGSDGSAYAIFDTGATTNRNRIRLDKVTNGDLRLLLYGSTISTSKAIQVALNGTSWPANTWHHVVFVWDQTGNIAYFLNGVSLGGSIVVGGAWTDVTSFEGTFLTIGAFGNSTAHSRSLHRDLIIYDHILSANEVSRLYARGR